MSASLIGRLGSSAFRQTSTARRRPHGLNFQARLGSNLKSEITIQFNHAIAYWSRYAAGSVGGLQTPDCGLTKATWLGKESDNRMWGYVIDPR
jgi:hypothetical protein